MRVIGAAVRFASVVQEAHRIEGQAAIERRAVGQVETHRVGTGDLFRPRGAIAQDASALVGRNHRARGDRAGGEYAFAVDARASDGEWHGEWHGWGSAILRQPRPVAFARQDLTGLSSWQLRRARVWANTPEHRDADGLSSVHDIG